MSKLMIVDLDQQAREQIERLVRITGKPEKTVLREVVTSELKTYNLNGQHRKTRTGS